MLEGLERKTDHTFWRKGEDLRAEDQIYFEFNETYVSAFLLKDLVRSQEEPQYVHINICFYLSENCTGVYSNICPLQLILPLVHFLPCGLQAQKLICRKLATKGLVPGYASKGYSSLLEIHDGEQVIAIPLNCFLILDANRVYNTCDMPCIGTAQAYATAKSNCVHPTS